MYTLIQTAKALFDIGLFALVCFPNICLFAMVGNAWNHLRKGD